MGRYAGHYWYATLSNISVIQNERTPPLHTHKQHSHTTGIANYVLLSRSMHAAQSPALIILSGGVPIVPTVMRSDSNSRKSNVISRHESQEKLRENPSSTVVIGSPKRDKMCQLM